MAMLTRNGRKFGKANMGKNLDFVYMADAPTETKCPECGADVDLNFDDCESDVSSDEHGKPNYLESCECECGCEFDAVLRLSSTVEIRER